jgi:tryptophanyl-tRNA synthetase
MSKSAESHAGVIWLLDEPGVTKKKIMRAVTDADGGVVFDRENKPGVANLLTIYSVLASRTIESLENEYAGRGYGDLKKGLVEVVLGTFDPIRERVSELLGDPAELDRVLAQNAARASDVANTTLAAVYDRVGLLPRL